MPTITSTTLTQANNGSAQPLSGGPLDVLVITGAQYAPSTSDLIPWLQNNNNFNVTDELLTAGNSLINDPSQFDVVWLVLPEGNLTSNDKAKFLALINAGGRIIAVGENPGFAVASNAAITDLSAHLGGNITITSNSDQGDGAADEIANGFPVYDNGNNVINLANNQVLDGVSRFDVFSAATLQIDPLLAEVYVVDDFGSILVADQLLSNGRMTVWADIDGFSNFDVPGFTNSNKIFFSNLLYDAAARVNSVANSSPSPSSGGGGGASVVVAPIVIDLTPVDPAPAGTNIQATDADGDGLREVITASDGSTIDGNRDGIPDVQQTEVAGLRLINDGAAGSDYGALVVSPEVRLSAVTLTAPASDGGLPVTARGGGTVVTSTPNGITNAFSGVVSFNVSGVTPGGSTQATISFPSGLPADSGNAYVRFNYSTNRFEEYVDASGAPLYSFVDTDGDGVFDAVNLTLVDGDPNWDGDGAANGTVVDPGFLASGERAFVGTKRRDVLTGNLLSNTIRGRKGNDWLQGGLGIDNLTGGRGRDRFVYTDAAESSAAQPDIVKRGRGDRFVFSAFDGDSTAEGRQSLEFIGKSAFSGVAGEMRGTRSVLEADLNGDSLADFAVNLRGNLLVTARDLVL
jgi:hypothetical protein